VEPYPHKFYFRETETMFHLHQITNKEDGEKHHLKVEWYGGKRPKYEGIKWMKEEYQRLQDLQHDGTLEKRRHLMPDKEWNTISQYHQVLTAALRVAIDDLDDDVAINEDGDDDDDDDVAIDEDDEHGGDDDDDEDGDNEDDDDIAIDEDVDDDEDGDGDGDDEDEGVKLDTIGGVEEEASCDRKDGDDCLS
jgi:hypothetical protein